MSSSYCPITGPFVHIGSGHFQRKIDLTFQFIVPFTNMQFKLLLTAFAATSSATSSSINNHHHHHAASDAKKFQHQVTTDKQDTPTVVHAFWHQEDHQHKSVPSQPHWKAVQKPNPVPHAFWHQEHPHTAPSQPKLNTAKKQVTHGTVLHAFWHQEHPNAPNSSLHRSSTDPTADPAPVSPRYWRHHRHYNQDGHHHPTSKLHGFAKLVDIFKQEWSLLMAFATAHVVGMSLVGALLLVVSIGMCCLTRNRSHTKMPCSDLEAPLCPHANTEAGMEQGYPMMPRPLVHGQAVAYAPVAAIE